MIKHWLTPFLLKKQTIEHLWDNFGKLKDISKKILCFFNIVII